MENKAIRGRDLMAPVKKIRYNGTEMLLKFDNNAFCIAEDVYSEYYHRERGIYQIMQECAIPKQRAIIAVMYGAMVSGGAEGVPFDDFFDAFKITDIDSVHEMVYDALMKSMPEPDEQKNA